MHTEGNEIHVSEEEASGGSKEGVVRWVLVVGLILAIGALSAIWIFGAASSSDPNADNVSVDAKIAAEQDRQGAAATTPLVTPPSEPAEAGDDRAVQNGAPVVVN